MMEVFSAFKFPGTREAKPLQTLSPERVNASRPASLISAKTKTTEETDSPDLNPSPFSSPSRRAKADLFADYHPSNGSPTKSTGFTLPQSPSLQEINALRAHVRTNSDVQGLVKRFEHLDVRDRDAESAATRKRHEAELRRAQIAREEAESDVKRLREEVRRMEKEADAGKERERKVAKRLEVVMEEFGTTKDSQSSQSAVYEKELRKTRKEAFKSSSAVLKLQEELKSTRNSLRITQSGFDLEKQKVHRKEQERFEMEYQLIPLQEEVEKLTQQLKVVEAEKEALKTSLREEEVTRIAAEGMIALPASQDHDDDLLSSPRKRTASPLSDDKENIHVIPKHALESRQLKQELEREKIRREHAEELAEFLRMECLFKCCSCRKGQGPGHELALELHHELAAGVEKIRRSMAGLLTSPAAVEEDVMEVEAVKIEEVVIEEIAVVESVSSSEPWIAAQPAVADLVQELDRSPTMAAESPMAGPSPDDQLREEAEKAFSAPSPTPTQQTRELTPVETILTIPLPPSSPVTPSYQDHQTTPFRAQPSIRTVTTTTTVPMHFTPANKPSQPFFKPIDPEDIENQPPVDESAVVTTPTFDRAAALAAIEYRRGRAKSIANGTGTPRKQMLEGVKERRDVSAPALGQKTGEAGGSARGRLGGSVRTGGRR